MGEEIGGDDMDVAMIISSVNGLLGIAFRLYNSIQQVQGDQPIPTWDELVDKNRILQLKIEAEK